VGTDNRSNVSHSGYLLGLARSLQSHFRRCLEQTLHSGRGQWAVGSGQWAVGSGQRASEGDAFPVLLEYQKWHTTISLCNEMIRGPVLFSPGGAGLESNLDREMKAQNPSQCHKLARPHNATLPQSTSWVFYLTVFWVWKFYCRLQQQ
jgi:hypothetical protein